MDEAAHSPSAVASNASSTPARAGVLAVLEALEDLGVVVGEGRVYRLQG